MSHRTRLTLAGFAAAALLAVGPGATQGHERIAEVRTWDGHSWQLSQPVLERLFTIVLGEEEPAEPRRGFTRIEVSLFGEAQPRPPQRRREVQQGRSPVGTFTLYQGGTEVRVSMAGVSTLLFTRQAVARSPLPPHVAPAHVRHAATAVMTDGSRVEADYVNLGATVLRGRTRHGRLEIPWHEIESIRFLR